MSNLSNQKIENNTSEALLPTPGETEELLNNNFTICPDCGSSIEILSINENDLSIKYKCLNEKKRHAESTNFIIAIEEYLKKIKESKDNKFDELKDKCHIENHNLNKYVSYCLECRCHLCEECLKTKEHINHRKSNMLEIQPIEEELNIIKEVINDYKKEKKDLENKKKEKLEEIDKSLNKEKEEEKNNYDILKKESEKKEKEELKENEIIYLTEVENIKKEYEKKLKIRKNQFLEENEIIITKFKLIKEKLEAEYNLKIKKLNENCNITKQNLGFIEKIKNKENMLKINEIIYNTYDNFTNNYYNSMTINNLLLYYNNNSKINNKMMNILGNKYENIIIIRKKKFSEDMQIKLEEEKQKMNEILNERNNELEELNQKLKDYEIKNNNLELEIRNMKDRNKRMKEEFNIIKEYEPYMKAKLEQGIRNVLGFSLAAHIPTEATFPLIISNAFKNICALSLGTNVLIDATKNMKDISDEKPKEEKPPEENEDDIDLGGLF